MAFLEIADVRKQFQQNVVVKGFNLGIEAFQLVVILAAMPWLVMLARSRAYGPLRIGGAAFTFVIKGGKVAVLAEAERHAGAIERPPLRWSQLRQARRFSTSRNVCRFSALALPPTRSTPPTATRWSTASRTSRRAFLHFALASFDSSSGAGRPTSVSRATFRRRPTRCGLSRRRKRDSGPSSNPPPTES